MLLVDYIDALRKALVHASPEGSAGVFGHNGEGCLATVQRLSNPAPLNHVLLNNILHTAAFTTAMAGLDTEDEGARAAAFAHLIALLRVAEIATAPTHVQQAFAERALPVRPPCGGCCCTDYGWQCSDYGGTFPRLVAG